MYENKDFLIEKISQFGLSIEASRTYLELIKSGAVGIMSICRSMGLGRNVVYKLLDELIQAGLVSVAERSFGRQYTAKQGQAFEALIASKEARIVDLRQDLEAIAAGLLTLSGETKATSRIIHFAGVAGLEQVNWNLTKATREFRVYEQSHIGDYLNTSFARSLYERYEKRGLVSYDLTNRKQVVTMQEAKNSNYWLNNSHYKHISPKILEIQFEMYIYDSVVTLLDYGSTDPHCIEIHNERLALMQTQIFNIVWGQAQKMVLDEKTGDRVVKKG